MTYYQAKLVILIGWYVIISAAAWIALDSDVQLNSETASVYCLLVTITATLLAGGTWKILRVYYIKKMLDETTLTESDIKEICRYVECHALAKASTLEEMKAIGHIVYTKAIGFSSADKRELEHFCFAAVLLHYSFLWKNTILCKDMEIVDALDQYHDSIKLLKYFRNRVH